MGTLTIRSKTHGNCRVQYDDHDAALVHAYNWYVYKSGPYLYACTHGRKIRGNYTLLHMHRLIAGAPAGTDVAHINHNTLDNRRENLR